ncbi:Sepiapterin reductase [Zancudomyces culisetae]|uniref:Sepiapterin reductase n=1 Tax=Zancudomyces culisetae TaxID=1213189 RepID=A0A1R1PWT2_ZANCU|nr:Sepiapterin reductase [Zancudomyces culisetae]|eukprot:OMH85455.1 Sepiapterin reductase [Zancudomyces culisetae]
MHSIYVLTGASGGFGTALATAISRIQDDTTKHVILCGRQSKNLESLAFKISNPQVDTYLMGNVDFSTGYSYEINNRIIEICDHVYNQIESPCIERFVFLHNAGSVGDLSKKISEYDERTDIPEYFNVNLISFAILSSTLLKWAKSKANCYTKNIFVVQISSLLAVKAFPNWGLYAAAKAARDQFLAVMAEEELDPEDKVQEQKHEPVGEKIPGQEQAHETIISEPNTERHIGGGIIDFITSSVARFGEHPQQEQKHEHKPEHEHGTEHEQTKEQPQDHKHEQVGEKTSDQEQAHETIISELDTERHIGGGIIDFITSSVARFGEHPQHKPEHKSENATETPVQTPDLEGQLHPETENSSNENNSQAGDTINVQEKSTPPSPSPPPSPSSLPPPTVKKTSMIKCLSYAPGPLNNSMQKTVRETIGDDTQRQLYSQMATDEKLVDMEDSARKLMEILAKNEFDSGSHIDYYDC